MSARANSQSFTRDHGNLEERVRAYFGLAQSSTNPRPRTAKGRHHFLSERSLIKGFQLFSLVLVIGVVVPILIVHEYVALREVVQNAFPQGEVIIPSEVIVPATMDDRMLAIVKALEAVVATLKDQPKETPAVTPRKPRTTPLNEVVRARMANEVRTEFVESTTGRTRMIVNGRLTLETSGRSVVVIQGENTQVELVNEQPAIPQSGVVY